MTGPRDADPNSDDVIRPTESASADRSEHAGTPVRPHGDELAHRAQYEAAEAHDEG